MNIVEKVAAHITEIFNANLKEGLHFHNLSHTKQTVDAVIELSEQCVVSKKEKEILCIAAWFHDVGFLESYKSHEQRSAEMAGEFLSNQKYPGKDIETVKNLILITDIKQSPETKLEKILRDADLSHLAKKSGIKRGEQLRAELKDYAKKEFSDEEWLHYDKEFYSNMTYFTKYAQENWQPKLNKNLEKINKKLTKLETNDMDVEDQSNKSKSTLSEKDIKRLEKIKASERGVETVFRTTSRNHLSLSSMADAKANTLISISALIISILISFLIDSIDVQPYLTIPTSILVVVCVITIVFATLSTRPKITRLGLTKEDIEQRRGNLLFFGNFYTMPLKEYEWGMNQLMEDREYLYNNLTRDIYFLGLVLAKKYKFLSIAYNVFMYGIIISVLSFLIAIHYSSLI